MQEVTELSELKTEDLEAIAHFMEAISSGKNWYSALLESISRWASPSEIYQGREYKYLISGEAFDLLVLAERLCDTVRDLIPEAEMVKFLFHNQPPVKISDTELKKLIGTAKYSAQLNYMYGVILEEALIGSVEQEIRKERYANGYCTEEATEEEAFRRIYGSDLETLLSSFRDEKHYRSNKALDLTELKELYYWLFKYRVKRCEKDRVASDTKKAINFLVAQWSGKWASQVVPELNV